MPSMPWDLANTCQFDHSNVCVHQVFKRDKRTPKLFSAENDTHPGQVPLCLENLTPRCSLHEHLLSCACTGRKVANVATVGMSSTSLKMCRDSMQRQWASSLVVRRHSSDNTHKDCRVQRANVLAALIWLKVHNPFYTDIEIDMDAIRCLPSNGIPEELLTINQQSQQQNDTSCTNVTIVKLYQCCTHHTCIACNGKVLLEPPNNELNRCGNCQMMQCIHRQL
jgi:hypothetical protein